MQVEEYKKLKQGVIEAGYSDEIAWVQDRSIVEDADIFMYEYIFVVLTTGFKEQVARGIFLDLKIAIDKGQPISSVVRHKQKAKAIEWIMRSKHTAFAGFKASTNPLEYLEGLPFIGPVTKYHLARNLGLDFVKPDRHLVRIAHKYGLTPHTMCENLARETGERIGTIDVVIWRAANLGLR